MTSSLGEWQYDFRWGKWVVWRTKGEPSEEGTQALDVLCECDWPSDAIFILDCIDKAGKYDQLNK